MLHLLRACAGADMVTGIIMKRQVLQRTVIFVSAIVGILTERKRQKMPKTAKRTTDLRLTVEYELDDNYKDVESLIDKAVGKTSDGSGAGFGSRDLGYYFKTTKSLTKPLSRMINLARKLEKKEIYLNISVGVSY